MRYILYCSILMLSVCSCKKSNNTISVAQENNKNVGASANDLLSNHKYHAVNIEIQYMQGFEPDANALAQAIDFLNKYCNKSEGITYTKKAIPGNGSTLALADVINIESKNRTVFNNGNTLGVYILFTDGSYNEQTVLGIAYKNTSLCLFGKTIHNNSGGIGQVNRTKLIATVLNHELGHILGLVDIGSPMQINHKDEVHGNHCNNNKCLMYYASETTDALGFLMSASVPDLDANCKNDLLLNGGK